MCYCLPAQQILGAYTLQSTLQAVVTDIYGIADSVSARITAAVNLASYASIHPLYIQARGHPRCLTIHTRTQSVNSPHRHFVRSFKGEVVHESLAGRAPACMHTAHPLTSRNMYCRHGLLGMCSQIEKS